MSTGLARLFADAVQFEHDGNNARLRELIEKEVNAELTNEQWQGDVLVSPLADIGDFLIRISALLSTVANMLAKGRHIGAFTKNKLEEMKIANDLSELQPLYDLNEKHSSLMSACKISPPCSCEADLCSAIAARLEKAATDVKQIWDGTDTFNVDLDIPAIFADLMDAEPNGDDATIAADITQDTLGNEVPYDLGHAHGENLRNHQTSQHSGEAESLMTIDGPDQGLLNALNRRGKGEYHCPEWSTCTKGGKKDGIPAVFERNSSYRFDPPSIVVMRLY